MSSFMSEEDITSRKRVKRSHELIECVIELDNGLVDRDLMARFATEILKYLLYDRQQIPFPLSNCNQLNELREKSSSKQLSTKEEQILVIIDDLNKVFNQLICLFNCEDIDINCVSLSLGQTLQMPKELYCIQMPDPEVYSVRHCSDCRRLTLRSSVTRFFKTILNDKNILFQNRRDISVTKVFVLIEVNKRFVKQVMDHSFKCGNTPDSRCSPFTPHIDYEIPKIGNRFKLIIKQKQCNCSHVLDNRFEVYDESVGQQRDVNTLDKQLCQTMAEVLTLNDIAVKDKDKKTTEDVIWIQIRSSVKGIQFKH